MQAGRGCRDSCETGGFIVSEKAWNSSIAMRFSAVPAFSQGIRRSSADWATYQYCRVSSFCSGPSSIICTSPSCFSVLGTSVILYSLKSIRIISTIIQIWIGMSIWAKKHSKDCFSTWICNKLGKILPSRLRWEDRFEQLV